MRRARRDHLAVRHVAYHEAGHYVVGRLLGVAPLLLHVSREGGCCVYTRHRRPEDVAAVAYAGTAAQARATKSSFARVLYERGGQADLHAARLLAFTHHLDDEENARSAREFVAASWSEIVRVAEFAVSQLGRGRSAVTVMPYDLHDADVPVATPTAAVTDGALVARLNRSMLVAKCLRVRTRAGVEGCRYAIEVKNRRFGLPDLERLGRSLGALRPHE